MSTRLLFNKHHGDAPPNAVYIGRGSEWGNPFVIGPDGTRDEVIDKFENLAERRYAITNKEALASLHGKPLVCFCYPKRCHGEVLIKHAARAYEELSSDRIVDF